MGLLLSMGRSLLNLFSFSWDYLVSVFGLNILYSALFSILIPFLIFIGTSYHKKRQAQKEGVVVRIRDMMKESLWSPKAKITGVIYILAWILLLTWGVTYTTYKDHEALKVRIHALKQERDDYKQKLEALEKEKKRLTSKTQPPEKGYRMIDAEKLAMELKNRKHSSAEIWNDGSKDAINFVQQFQIGLQMAGWKMVDGGPWGGADFPDSLTIEVSSTAVSDADHSKEVAKILKKALEKLHIEAVLRFTDQKFPPNFMRIKVAGQ
jgi:hypothetical protein